jgi:hypothetical protein
MPTDILTRSIINVPGEIRTPIPTSNWHRSLRLKLETSSSSEKFRNTIFHCLEVLMRYLPHAHRFGRHTLVRESPNAASFSLQRDTCHYYAGCSDPELQVLQVAYLLWVKQTFRMDPTKRSPWPTSLAILVAVVMMLFLLPRDHGVADPTIHAETVLNPKTPRNWDGLQGRLHSVTCSSSPTQWMFDVLPSRCPLRNILSWQNTRWFKYDRDYLCVNKSQFVPVIFEPPCTLWWLK